MDTPMPFLAASTVFQIAELLELVIQELDKRSLARMARVSSSAHQLSIRTLGASGWIYSDTFFQLFPISLIPLNPTPDQKILFPHARDPIWARFKHYSIHVTRLTIRPSKHHSNIFARIKSCTAELFPILQHLTVEWTPREDYTNVDWLAVAGLPLRTLNLTDCSSYNQSLHTSLNLLLHLLPLQTPALREFTLSTRTGYVNPIPDFFVETLCLTIELLPHLTVFSCPWWRLPIQVVNALAAHPVLGTITLYSVPQSPTGGTTPFLQGLARLHLNHTSEIAAGSWLGNLSQPAHLKRVEFFEVEPWGPLSPGRLLTRGLRRAINITHIDISSQGRMAISWDEFSTLAVCRLVSDFRLNVKEPLQGEGGMALQALLAAWGELEHIEIIDPPLGNRDSPRSLSIYALRYLAEHCPKLRYVSLVVAPRRDEWVLGACRSWEASPKPRPLEYLHLYVQGLILKDDDVPSARNIARMLRSFWPTTSPHNIHLDWWGQFRFGGVMIERFQCVRYILEETGKMDELKNSVSILEGERTRLSEDCARLERELLRTKTCQQERTERTREG